MTRNPALALAEMAKRSPESAKKTRPPRGYGAMLMRRAATIGLARADVARLLDMSDQTVWRVETDQPQASVLAANKIRGLLVQRGLDIPPMPVGVEVWEEPGAPTAAAIAGAHLDDESETIRRNLVEARERLGYDLHDVNSLTGIPLETLRAYELGREQPSGIHLKQLASCYRVTMNDLTEPAMPPPDPSARKVIHMRTEPGALEMLTAEERERLERLRQEIAALNEAARKRAESSRHQKRRS